MNTKKIQKFLTNIKQAKMRIYVLVPGKTKQFLYNRIIVGEEEEEEITNDFDFDSTI